MCAAGYSVAGYGQRGTNITVPLGGFVLGRKAIELVQTSKFGCGHGNFNAGIEVG